MELPIRRKKRAQPEFLLHVAVMDLLRRAARPDVIFYHCPNGENRNVITGKRLKRMGALPGVADICLVLPPDGRAAFLELKPPKEKQSDAQLMFEVRCEKVGAPYAVAHSIDEAHTLLRAMGALKRGTQPVQPPLLVAAA